MAILKCNPTDCVRITSKFGPDHKKGIDIGAMKPAVAGDPIYAINDGVVKLTKVDATGYGNYLVLEHIDCCSLYAHLIALEISEGKQVKAGDIIGHMGYTGHCIPSGVRGTHLHFEIREGKYKDFWSNPKFVDPEPLLRKNVLSITESLKILEAKCNFDISTLEWQKTHPWYQDYLSKLAKAMK